MPIYEYHCASCGFQKEFLQKMSDPVLTKCPECSKETLSKMVTAAAFKLKGSGWYATDFKNGNGSSPKPAAQSTSSGESSESAAHSCGSGHCGVCS
ncbi:MAG TPA: zinc ribbon domain-containing protein [Burkholderiales bacterium]